MTGSAKNIKVTDLGQLDDKRLVTELQKRLKDDRLAFISYGECRSVLGALSKVTPESAAKLWQPLMESAITFLKMHDPREWGEESDEPSTKEEKSSLKAFGIERLRKYFIQFKEFEKILYGAERYYHEHTLHVLRVWILGALLLDDWFQTGNMPSIEFFEDVEKKTGKPVGELISKEEIQAMWCIIALSHDLGYPLQKIDSINEQARAMLRQYAKVNLQDLNFDVPQQHQFINDFILKFISSRTMMPEELINKFAGENSKEEDSGKIKERNRDIIIEKKKRIFRTHVQSKYYLKYSKSLEDFEHGIFSAILLMRSLTYFLESDFDMDELKPLDFDDAKQCAIRREILRAIACHTCEEIYHISPDTLGCLLIICDELQSWGRPTFEEMPFVADTEPIATLKKFDSQEVEFQLKLPGDKRSLHNRSKTIFRRLHKIFRVAVDAPERKFNCRVTIESKDCLPDIYKFEFTSKRPQFKFTCNGSDFDLWGENTGEDK